MNTTTKTINKPTEPAAPCPVCHSPTYWRSAYGGPLRCAVCDEWPSLAMVGERWTVVLHRDGSRVWMPCLRRGERAKVVEPSTSPGDTGIHCQELDDENGHWLVISKTKHTQAVAGGDVAVNFAVLAVIAYLLGFRAEWRAAGGGE